MTSPSFETGEPASVNSSPPPSSVVPVGQVAVAWAAVKSVVLVIAVLAETTSVSGALVFTEVAATAKLFAGFGSVTAELTLTVFANVPVVDGVALIATEAEPLGESVPMLQVTTPDSCEQLPWLGVAESAAKPLGSVSVSVTLVALLVVLPFETADRC